MAADARRARAMAGIRIDLLARHPALLPDVAGLIHRTWPEALSAGYDAVLAQVSRWRGEHQLPLGLVALGSSGELLGFAALTEAALPQAGDGVFLTALVVAPEARGRGVGQQLCRAAVGGARRLGAGPVYACARETVQFYYHQGWRFVAEVDAPGPWSNEETVLLIAGASAAENGGRDVYGAA